MSLENITMDCSKIIDNLKQSIKTATKKIYSKQSYILSLLITQDNSTLYNDLDLLTDELAEDYKINIEKTVDLTGIKENIFSKITELNNDERLGGIYIDDLDLDLLNYESVIYSMVHPSKDAGALNVVNSGLLFYEQQLILPPKVSSIIKILDNLNIQLAGQYIVIINKSARLGKPLSLTLLQKNINVALLDVQMTDFKKICKNASIVISGIDQPNSLKSSLLKKDTILIDTGDYFNEQANLYIEDNENITLAQYIDPVSIKELTLLFILYNFLRVIFFNNSDKFDEE